MGPATTPARLLVAREAPAGLAHDVFSFVHRDDPLGGGQVVRVLPDIRPAIQIMLQDPYWLRDCRPGAAWAQVPKISLWGPRYLHCDGFARAHIKAYAVGLTVAGLRRLTGRSAAGLVDRVVALETFAPDLALALTPAPLEAFEAWSARAAEALEAFFGSRPVMDNPVAGSLEVLAGGAGGAVAAAARLSGLSERQYRRLFAQFHGVSPKRFQRVLRVDRMLRQLHERPWERDAFEDDLAFADQPHAIREFRAVTGLTPRAYVQAKRDGDPTLRSVATPNPPAPPPEAL